MNPVTRVHEPIQLITSSVTALRAGATTSSIHHNHLQLRSDRRATYEISKALIYILDCFNGISKETSIVNGVSIKTSFNNMQYYISALKLYPKHHVCLRYHWKVTSKLCIPFQGNIPQHTHGREWRRTNACYHFVPWPITNHRVSALARTVRNMNENRLNIIRGRAICKYKTTLLPPSTE